MRAPSWGWVIYRCSYKDEKLWTNFLSEWDKAIHESIFHFDEEKYLPSMDLKIVEDPSLEGASKESICERHYAWAKSVGCAVDWTKEHSEENNYFPSPRHQFAVQVDEGALQSAWDHRGKPPGESVGKSYANLLFATKYMGKEAAGERSGDRPWVNNRWWMRLELYGLPVYAYHELTRSTRWYWVYQEPPQIAGPHGDD
ncbi:uncharacterized protein GIQ15_05289 [Arthroderma uncinatum]|uniref:uncharacterized protein n=1 Tax=Arthroderma uncinatum TaxID=74035 RepID=UPI00144A878C|nr:uncharacterized protein GIQ15_05289 [Arthroderma uncinatum]KAF3482530.1 hypothetical protein GIQ15_05289 [Arthroderma uncinatum]